MHAMVQGEQRRSPRQNLLAVVIRKLATQQHFVPAAELLVPKTPEHLLPGALGALCLIVFLRGTRSQGQTGPDALPRLTRTQQ